jgi:hypothetical protein
MLVKPWLVSRSGVDLIIGRVKTHTRTHTPHAQLDPSDMVKKTRSSWPNPEPIVLCVKSGSHDEVKSGAHMITFSMSLCTFYKRTLD